MADTNGTAIDNVEKKVIKQVEYYFGDVNLFKDRFLKEKVKEDEGWVTVETMLKFNRLKKITEDPQVILGALKKSTSGLIEVNETDLKIRRKPERPLPANTQAAKQDLLNRSIYAKSFPLESTLDEIEQFFEQYGPIDNVYLKKDFHTKTFKGSVFVAFKNTEDLNKFLEEEGTKYNDVELIAKMKKSDYHTKKQEDRKSEKAAKAAADRAEKEAEEKRNPPPLPDLTGEEEDDKVRNQMTKGAVLKLQEMNPENNTRESVKDLFAEHGEVAWVDFDKGVTEGYIRLREPNSAALALESLQGAFENGVIMLNESKIEVAVVEGDEEFEYWKKMFRDIYERNRKGRENRRRKEGGRGGGKGGRRSGGGDRGDRRRNKGGNKRGWGGEDMGSPPVKMERAGDAGY